MLLRLARADDALDERRVRAGESQTSRRRWRTRSPRRSPRSASKDEKLDADKNFTIVGFAQNVEFSAPPLLVRFLFGKDVLTDVEFALREEGQLVPA